MVFNQQKNGLEFYGLNAIWVERIVFGNYWLNAIWVKHRVPIA